MCLCREAAPSRARRPLNRFVQALSVAQAVGFLGVQLSVGLAVLLSLNKSVPHSSSRCI